ncbi:MAG: alanine racemase [Oscillospiraceae bacterium]|nr:alanine racemase [Oscillospiraceae bacterium]
MKYLVIDRRVMRNNLRMAKERAGGVEIYGDLSANAYGMGLIETARLLRDEGIRSFAVSDPGDADALRKQGMTEERLMMLRSTADQDELTKLIDLGVICTVGSYDAAVAINGIAELRGTVAEVQIKIDTGLGRYGFMPTETERIASIYKYLSSIVVTGTFTTFSASWKSRKLTLEQLDAFNGVLDKLTDMGFEPGPAHACDSAALFRYDFGMMDAVRVGEALSGRVPGKAIPGLGKVGFIEAGIEEVGWFQKGHSIGGEHGVTLGKPTKIAVMSVGYYHGFGVGFRRSRPRLSDVLRRSRRLSVKINGQRAHVLGDVGLMHTLADVTNIECTAGDIAVMDVDPINVKGLARMYR